MALPDGAQTITITDRRTHPDGGPMRGRVALRPAPAVVANAALGHTVQGDAEARWVDGELSLTVLAADATGYEPTGYTHVVEERPDDAPGRDYPVRLTSDLGPTITLAELTPTAPYDGTYVLVPGPRGTDGTDGIDGADGADGQDGASAYQLALADGFIGTQAQWIASLKGDKGEKGEKGDPGTPPTGDVVGITRTFDKATDRPFTTTSLEADEQLVCPVSAGGRYAIAAMLALSGDPAADFLFTIAAPPGSTGYWAPGAITLGVSDGTGSIRLTSYLPGQTVGVGVTAAGLILAPLGTITAAADGVLTIRGAQNAPHATPTVLRAGSWLRVTRTA